jgi:hypothetical protein
VRLTLKVVMQNDGDFADIIVVYLYNVERHNFTFTLCMSPCLTSPGGTCFTVS